MLAIVGDGDDTTMRAALIRSESRWPGRGRCPPLLLLVVFLLLEGACQRGMAELHAPESRRPDVGVPDDFSLTMRQTACFGSCPVYDLQIDADGNVHFEGHAYTALRGEQRGFAPAPRLSSLLREAHRLGLFSLEQEGGDPCMVVRDEASVIVELHADGRTALLNASTGCDQLRAAVLYRFADHAMDLLGVRAWVHPVPKCRWRVDRRGADALAASSLDVALAADGVAAAIAAAYHDHRATGLRVTSWRQPEQTRRDARRRAHAMVQRLERAGVPNASIAVRTVAPRGRGAGPPDDPLTIDLDAERCRPPSP